MKMFEIRAAFAKILQKLDVIDAKVSAMPQVQVQISSKFLATLNALGKLGRAASASEIAQVTGKRRAVESALLNELVGRGLLTKERDGRSCLFSVKNRDDCFEGE
jgi:DNA-binding transcriptional ArsR family regulator